MKCKALIMTHGKLAGSLYETVRFIYGSTEGLAYLDMPEPFDKNAYEATLEKIVSENEKEGILILCDLFGGSPFLTSAKILKEHFQQVELVTGVNLGMLLELMTNIESASIEELKQIAVNSGKDGIVDIKERLGK